MVGAALAFILAAIVAGAGGCGRCDRCDAAATTLRPGDFYVVRPLCVDGFATEIHNNCFVREC
jgi:hypothetical protein